ncbi:hypothetical protein LCM08_06310 [Salipiger pacificus]|nr:hypothetical protein [Alloyangia pacifica]
MTYHYDPARALGFDRPEVDRDDWIARAEETLIRAGRRAGLRQDDAETLADRAIGIAKRGPDDELERTAKRLVRQYLAARREVVARVGRLVP